MRLRFAVALVACFWLTISCTVPASDPVVIPPTLPPATQPPELTPPSAAGTAALETMRVQVFATSLQAPWAIERAPDGRFFVSERPGRVRVIKEGQLQAEPWITLPVTEFSEAGLMGLAIDPQFNQNRYVYVAYSYREGIRISNRLVRLRENSSGKGELDRTLIDAIPGAPNHDGARVKFGPDGKLYLSMGDAQNGSLSQNLASLNGKILRLNSDGSVPSDNPFQNSYIYAYGLRNPQGLAWQPGTNRLYATDHGPSGFPSCCRDEVNYIEAGKNYGWPEITGDQTRSGMVAPVVQSGADITWAPSGATFVSGGPWAGSFLFAGLRGQALYRVTFDANDPSRVLTFEPLFQNQYGRLRDVYEAPDGAIYVLTSNRDGRGSPRTDDDRVLRLTFQ